MILRRDAIVLVPAGGAVAQPVETVCASGESVLPPPPLSEGVTYSPATYPDAAKYEVILSIFDQADRMCSQGTYDGIILPPERRQRTIEQLAIWMMFNDQYKITNHTIKNDLLASASVRLDTLSSERDRQIDSAVMAIFNLAD